jgi:hypothetical protein
VHSRIAASMPSIHRALRRTDAGLLMIVFVFATLFALFIACGTYRPFFQRIHANDPVGYYAWARSAMFDHDFQFENEFRRLNVKTGLPVDSLVNPDAPRTRSGHVPNGFAIGCAVLWAPFIAAIHPLADYLGGEPDGFSQPYFMAVFLAITFYGFAGVVVLYYALRTWYPAGISAMASLAAWGASPMLFYTFPDGAMAHSGSMFAMCVFFLAWVRLRDRTGSGAWFVIGLGLGLAVLVRWQNVTYAIVPAVDLLSRVSLRRLRLLGSCAAGTVFGFLPQMVGWWIVFGSPITVPQGPDFIHWAHPRFYDLFFSNAAGLVTWTPLCGVAIVGLAFAPRSIRQAYVAMAAGLAVQFYLNACLYEAGWSFGMRRLDNAVPIFAAGLAALYLWLAAPWKRNVAYSISCVAIGWNVLFALQYGGILDGMYRHRIYTRLAHQYKVPITTLEETHSLPDGTPIDPNACVFPRAGGATFEQFTYDKILVIRMIAHNLFGTSLPE